jgi:pimeloyl-ACP methyl ester carboxylesterase
VATAVIDGIETHYDVLGDGPPLLMFSPGGFDATIDKWRTQGIYATIKLLDHLPRRYRCIVFDRRETGQSGGRVERITWAHYAAQGIGLLDHLGLERAHVMGACMGVCAAAALAVAQPARVQSLVLYFPVGGARYRMQGHARFGQHLAYAQEHGLAGVVSLAAAGDKSFGADPRGGPWVSVLRRDPAFAVRYAAQDPERYKLIVTATARGLFDRDTAPGAEPEELMQLDLPALIVPGRDHAHALSAARYLEECLPRAQYWDVPVAGQTETTAPARVLEFLDTASAGQV